MLFAKVEAGEIVTYPYTVRQFKADNPNVSPPEDMSGLVDFGVVVVQETPVPAYDSKAVRMEEGTPQFNGSAWAQTWVTTPLPAEELAQYAKWAAQSTLETHVKADAFVQQFVGFDANQVQDYIQNNVTDLASAKAVIKKLALICLALAKTRLS